MRITERIRRAEKALDARASLLPSTFPTLADFYRGEPDHFSGTVPLSHFYPHMVAK